MCCLERARAVDIAVDTAVDNFVDYVTATFERTPGDRADGGSLTSGAIFPATGVGAVSRETITAPEQ